MKNINRQTHTFIFELVIAIAFFALASSICVQFFVKAHSLSKETNDINISMNLATGYVEEFLNDPTIYQVNQEYIHYYDKNWKDCHKKNSMFNANQKDELLNFDIYAESDKDSIETIHVRVYHYHKKIYSITSDQYIKEDNHES